MTKKTSLHVKVYIDGGARGNPGPAAAGIIVRSAEDLSVLHASGVFLGQTTNNVAEYSGLVTGLIQAEKLKAEEAEFFSDSELLVRQMNGQYKVRNPGLIPLHRKAQKLASKFRKFSITHISREQNEQADRLVNEALESRSDVQLDEV